VPESINMSDIEKWAERLWNAQKLDSEVYLRGDSKPTRNQVAAVLHSLADHTAIVHMLVEAKVLGKDRMGLGKSWVRSTGVGRYLQALGDAIESGPERGSDRSMHEGTSDE
jgi:hypothetical protein